MPHGQKKKNKTKNIKQKQYSNKFNKDFKNGPHQKKKLKKKVCSIYLWLSLSDVFKRGF